MTRTEFKSHSVLLAAAGLLLLCVHLGLTHPAEASGGSGSSSKVLNDSVKTTTTTEKPVRHPNYVRLLNRRKSENETGTKPAKSGAELLATLPKNRSLSTDEIKSIIPYLEFTTEKPFSLFGSSSSSSSSSSSTTTTSSNRPRGLSSLLNLLMAPINAFRNFGNRNRDKNVEDNASSGGGFHLSVANFSNRDDKGGSSNKTSSSSSPRASSSSTSTKAVPTPAPANNLLAGPGRFLAGMMKSVQNLTVTFQDMITSFLRLFNFNRNRNN